MEAVEVDMESLMNAKKRLEVEVEMIVVVVVEES